MLWKRDLIKILAVLLLVCGCAEEIPPDKLADFGHGSPRPDCSYHIDLGREPYYRKPVVVSMDWSEPIKLSGSLNTPCPEDAVEISRDGKTLYFFWSPTVNATNEELLHITTGTYWAERVGDNLGEFTNPRLFDLQKGADGGSVDSRLSFTPEGDFVYFHSTRTDNLGHQQSPPIDDTMDIYVAPISNGEPEPALNLGEPVNSVYLDGEHALSPDGLRLFLTSTRPGGLGGADIWVSTQTNGIWSTPINLDLPINSASMDGQPGFAADDPNTMYFVSERDGPASIYRSTYDGKRWSEPEMVITGYVGEPSLIGDGSVMYFVHVFVDDKGIFGSDIWYVQQVRGE
jgi:hypothetical protein